MQMKSNPHAVAHGGSLPLRVLFTQQQQKKQPLLFFSPANEEISFASFLVIIPAVKIIYALGGGRLSLAARTARVASHTPQTTL